ncbi:hypothetical protein LAZ67_4000829 [Cordylochernes scorpioides]|uniref:Uncharacterized protein n=1 Tax=Cordylochernes scorpioides TaxID=51811 RepID=A0ABY6KEY5_9ARAC|nr:hypothetical protein LAZ67_4000829 [Cordylochernes scorpioides]
MLQWLPILAKVQPHQRVQVTKRGSGTFVLLVLATSIEAYYPGGGVSHSSRKQDDFGNYAFHYDVADPHGASNGRWESGDGYGNKRGAYTIRDLDGRERRVEYIADHHGFRAIVKTNEPGTAASAPAAVFLVLATSIEAYYPGGGVSHSSRKQDDFGNYAFHYDVADPHGASNGRWESGDGYGNKRGAYTIRDLDGRERRVEYIADHHGFRAIVKTNEPGTAASAPAAVVVASPYLGPTIHPRPAYVRRPWHGGHYGGHY